MVVPEGFMSSPDSAINLLHGNAHSRVNPPHVWMLDSLQTAQLPSEDAWWQHFNDPTLNKLMLLAEENNYNLKIAMKRIELSYNALRQAKAGYFPTIDLSADWETGRSSGVTGRTKTIASNYSYFSIGATASWEVDLFGRIRANMNAEKAGINVAKADYVNSMISICADVAQEYINIRLYQQQLAIATRHINSQERIVHITEARYDSGLASLLDVLQARTVLYSTQATLPSLHALIRTSINALGLLIGVPGNDLEAMLGNSDALPDSRQLIPAAVPADIVRRRPDIIAAQYQLEETAALLGVAKKAYLPSFTISGSIGTSARNIGDLFSKPSFTYMVSPQISWTVFDGQLRNLKVAEEKLQLESDLESYNLTVLTASEEVNNAIDNYQAYQQEISLREKVVEESEKSLALALDRYKQGLSPFTNVVDAQQSLLEYQNSYVSSKAKALQSLIDLYVAMGGGWSTLPE